MSRAGCQFKNFEGLSTNERKAHNFNSPALFPSKQYPLMPFSSKSNLERRSSLTCPNVGCYNRVRYPSPTDDDFHETFMQVCKWRNYSADVRWWGEKLISACSTAGIPPCAIARQNRGAQLSDGTVPRVRTTIYSAVSIEKSRNDILEGKGERKRGAIRKGKGKI